MSPDAPRGPKFDPQDGSAASESPRPSPAEAAGETPAEAQGGPPSPLPAAAPGLPKHLEPLADRARDYIKASSAENTRRAYGADWRHYNAWCRRQSLDPLPPDPQTIGLYITACAAGKAGPKPDAVSTIERRLAALSWRFRQRRLPFHRQDRHGATAAPMAGRQSRRTRSGPRTSSPCSRRSTAAACAACAIAPCC